MHKITPWLWFESEAEEAVDFYTAVFRNSRVLDVKRYGAGGPLPEGTVLTVAFELDGQHFAALNGGQAMPRSDSVSFQVLCESQAEVDDYWAKLTDGGEEVACGWLRDRYGVAWQIVPTRLPELLDDPDPARAERATQAMLTMKKLDIAALERAADG